MEGVITQVRKICIPIISMIMVLFFISSTTAVVAPKIQPVSNQTVTNDVEALISHRFEQAPYLLIFLSPQYYNDVTIISKIKQYQEIISLSPRWNSQLILLSEQTNHPDHIDIMIEKHEQSMNLTACLFIGEDISYPIKTTFQNINKLNLSMWSTISASPEARKSKRICISLLYPTPSASYDQKRSELINTLNRFIKKRMLSFENKATIIEQPSLARYSKTYYQQLTQKYNAKYYQHINSTQFISLLQTTQDLICIHGHGQPNMVQLPGSMKLTSRFASHLSTTMLAIDGCYTDSVFTNQSTNDLPFLSTLCRSETMHIGLFGLLSQQTSTNPSNVINTILLDLNHHKTIAEAINDAQISFDFVLTGDPTFLLN